MTGANATLYWKFKDGPFRGLLFRVEQEDAAAQIRTLRFVQYERIERVPFVLYAEWRAVEVP